MAEKNHKVDAYRAVISLDSTLQTVDSSFFSFISHYWSPRMKYYDSFHDCFRQNEKEPRSLLQPY